MLEGLDDVPWDEKFKGRDGIREHYDELLTAFPDLDYHFKVIGAEGDVVKATMQLSGTHSGSFDLRTMDMGVIPATNKNFSAKPEKARVTVRENKITAWFVEPTQGADLKSILDQLGVKSTVM